MKSLFFRLLELIVITKIDACHHYNNLQVCATSYHGPGFWCTVAFKLFSMGSGGHKH